MKRIVTIQDISCVGRCSLTVALPIISAMGVETAVLPTAVLSNHTAFPEFSFHDLTDEIPAIENVWEKLEFKFDAVYSGYLGSLEQIREVRDVQNRFLKKDGWRFVDPAMADNGALYSGFTKEFVSSMADLCKEADVIVPNLTEACFMTGTEYRSDYKTKDIKELARKLSDAGTPNVIITGFSTGDCNVGALVYKRKDDSFSEILNEKLPGAFHGTGDIFASVVLGTIVNGSSIEEAAQKAVDFVYSCVKKTLDDNEHHFYGVNFEAALPLLTGGGTKE